MPLFEKSSLRPVLRGALKAVLFVLMLELGLRAGGWIFMSAQELKNKWSFRQKPGYTLLCVGDSVTLGLYPRLLEETLNNRHPGVKFSVVAKGVPGGTSSLIVSQLKGNLDKYKPDAVIALMGEMDERNYRTDATEKGRLNAKKPSLLESARVYKLLKGFVQDLSINISSFYAKWRVVASNLKPKNVARRVDRSGNALDPDMRDFFTAFEQKDYSKAERALERALKSSPDNKDAYFGLGRVYFEQGRFSRAREMFDKYLEYEPSSPAAHLFLARIHSKSADSENAERLSAKAKDLLNISRAAEEKDRIQRFCLLMEEGKEFSGRSKFDEAAVRFEKALALFPEDIKCLFQLGWSYKKLSRISEAEKIFRRIVEIAPELYDGYIGLGWLYAKTARFQESESMFDKARKLNPKDPGVYCGLAEIFVGQTRHSDAEKILQEALKRGLTDPMIYFWLAHVHENRNEYDKAEEMFKKAIAMKPDLEGAYIVLAYLHTRLNKFDKAEELLKQAIAANPGNVVYYINLAWVYQGRAKLAEAEEMFLKAVELDPSNAKSYVGLGWCRQRKGDYAGAEEFYLKALSLAKDRTFVIMQLLKNLMSDEEYRAIRTKMASAGRLPIRVHSVTRRNYARLKAMLDERGIQLICLQYPARSVEALKAMFEDKEGVVFFDTQRLFEKAIGPGKYNEYFSDLDNHLTEKGARVLAQALADVIDGLLQ